MAWYKALGDSTAKIGKNVAKHIPDKAKEEIMKGAMAIISRLVVKLSEKKESADLKSRPILGSTKERVERLEVTLEEFCAAQAIINESQKSTDDMQSARIEELARENAALKNKFSYKYGGYIAIVISVAALMVAIFK